MYQQGDKMHPHGSSWSLSVFLSPSLGVIPSKTDVYSHFGTIFYLKNAMSRYHIFFHHFLLFVSMAVRDLRKRQMSLQSDSTFPFCPTKKMLLSLTHTHIHNQTLCVLLHLWSTRIQKSQMVMMMCFFYFLLGT